MIVDKPKYYTIAELCEMFHCSRRTIANRVRLGEFGDPLNPSQTVHLVSELGLKSYISSHTGPAYSEKQVAVPQRHRRHMDCMAKI